mmetsp:Transcript_27458/g.50669  ORF Transcript_27458/g.50669 Transcript_27458/m.50669 type:complete len:657 (-) Transcript_27458:79-2049(-)
MAYNPEGNRQGYIPPNMRGNTKPQYPNPNPYSSDGPQEGYGNRPYGGGNDYGGRSYGRYGGGGYGGNYGGNRGNYNNYNQNFHQESRPSTFSYQEDPFKKEDDAGEIQRLCANENTGIDFSAYEDIPVKTSGRDVPKCVESFEGLELPQSLLENIKRCNFTKPTPVQKYSIPIGIAGRDLMACAQTGSGKTAAFCFPILASMIMHNFPPKREANAQPYVLILAPTRELSTQIYNECRKFSFKTDFRSVVVYGGSSVGAQLRDLSRGCDVLVATPGRLNDLIERGRVYLNNIHYLCLDEADRMLDMGFVPQIRKIVLESGMPPPGQRQTLLFSATFPREIQELARDFLDNYIFLSVGTVGSTTDLIEQRVVHVSSSDKKATLLDLLALPDKQSQGLTLVFVETKRGADELENFLCVNKWLASSIHGDRSQGEREAALRSFKSGRTPILVATDVAARGLDIPHVNHVINFDLPKDIDDYIHRIGRTGRAGKHGLATAFFCENDSSLARDLQKSLQDAKQEVPSFLSSYANTSSYAGKGKRGGGRFSARDYRRDTGGYNGGGGGGYNSYGNQGGGYHQQGGYNQGGGHGGYGGGGGGGGHQGGYGSSGYGGGHHGYSSGTSNTYHGNYPNNNNSYQGGYSSPYSYNNNNTSNGANAAWE